MAAATLEAVVGSSPHQTELQLLGAFTGMKLRHMRVSQAASASTKLVPGKGSATAVFWLHSAAGALTAAHPVPAGINGRVPLLLLLGAVAAPEPPRG